jgi:hypothetical protein
LLQLNPENVGVHDVERVQLSPDQRTHVVCAEALLLQMTTAQKSGGRKLIDGRREDLRRHARPDQIRNNRLS